MGYYEFLLRGAGESCDAITNMLAELGCLGTFERDGLLVAFFRDGRDVAEIRDSLAGFRSVLRESGLDAGYSFDYHYLSERDWNESWKRRFEPVDVGESLAIVPPWKRDKDGRISIIIDPGMAFGTGHHETTRTCLGLIERISRTCRRERFLDVGTGTGILAIGAARLGFSRVTAVDIDPLATDAALRNASLNGLSGIEVFEGTIDDAEGPFDLIAANLIAGTLIRLAHSIALHLDVKGTAVLSGMLAGQEDAVISAFAAEGVLLEERIEDGRWVSLVLRR